MNRNASVAIGIVRSLDDPENRGRVQVQFPWMDDVLTSPWASIATPMAGAGRGLYFMPEEEDECLVAFEHGSFDHPYIVGFLWNGVDAPPNTDIDRHVRRYQSRSGHVLDFNDQDDALQIRIRTQGGHEILLDDSSGSEKITLTTKGENKVELHDGSAAKILLEDKGGSTVELSASGISLTAAAGKDVSISGTNVSIEGTNVSVEGTAVDVTATAKLSLAGTPVHLNP